MSRRLPAQHENRLALALELHARPFPEVKSPGRAAHLAFKKPKGAADGTRSGTGHICAHCWTCTGQRTQRRAPTTMSGRWGAAR